MSLIGNIAMSQRTPSHWLAMSSSVSITASTKPWLEDVQLQHVRPAGKVGIAPVREHLPVRPERTTSDRSAASSGVSPDEVLGMPVTHGWSGATWFGHEIEHEREPPAGERSPGDRQTVAAPEVLVDDVFADAVRRSDVVVRPEVRERLPEVFEQARVLGWQSPCPRDCAARRPSARRHRTRATPMPSQASRDRGQRDGPAVLPAQRPRARPRC